MMRPGANGVLLTAIATMALLTASCDPASVRKRQFVVQGERLYLENCSNCHQPDGSGLALLYPPLNDPEIVNQPQRIACAIRNGVAGEKQIAGKKFNQPMSAIDNLTDLEIAEIITFLTTTWGQGHQTTEAKTVQELIDNCR